MDLSGYNVFVFEHINTREYILFTCQYNKNFEQTDTNGTKYYPINFLNQYIKSVLVENNTTGNIINKVYSIYNKETGVGDRDLGQIHFEGQVNQSGSGSGSGTGTGMEIKIESYVVTKSTGMFSGITKIVIDSTLPDVKIYFVKELDYF
jgi:hypothetical protein